MTNESEKISINTRIFDIKLVEQYLDGKYMLFLRNKTFCCTIDWTVEAIADTVSSFAAQVWHLQIVRLAPTISVRKFEALSQIQLFPIPPSLTLSITQLPKNDQNISVAVVDQSGRVVMHKELVDGLDSYSLNIEHLASGTYFVKISNAHVQNSMKFIKL